MPYVIFSKGVIPGVANWYASTCKQCNAGCAIHVKTLDGRAKKIEGNPTFPINFGRVCARGQAGLQVLYNPDRIKSPKIKEKGKFKKISWSKAESIVVQKLQETASENQKDRVAFITEPLRSSQGKLLSTFAKHFGSNNIYNYDFLSDQNLAKANELCFGINAIPHYDIANAHFVLSFNTDLLDTWATPVKHSVAYSQMRDKEQGENGKRGWLVQLEPRLSLTGTNADEWHPIEPESEGLIALAIAHVIVNEKLNHPSVNSELGKWKDFLKSYTPEHVAKKSGLKKEVIEKIAHKFAENQPGIAIGGGYASNQKDGIANSVGANILNHLVGSINKEGGVQFNQAPILTDSVAPTTSHSALNDLSKKMANNEIDVVFINNANPVFNLPNGSSFKNSLIKVPFIVSFSPFMDDTTSEANIILPSHTFLESWDDSIPLVDNGTRAISLLQPVIKKVFNTKQVGNTILSLAHKLGGSVSSALHWKNALDHLKANWQTLYSDAKARKKTGNPTFEDFWNKSLKKGGYFEDIPSFANPTTQPKPESLPKPSDDHTSDSEFNFHLHAYPSVNLYDGRGANQPWLQ